MRRLWILAAGANGLAAVVAGAAAQHLLAGDAHSVSLTQTAILYGLTHAAVLVALAAHPAPVRPVPRWLLNAAGGSLALGTTLFSFSLYALAADLGPLAGRATPVGGTLMILGWGLLLLYGLARGRRG